MLRFIISYLDIAHEVNQSICTAIERNANWDDGEPVKGVFAGDVLRENSEEYPRK